VANAAKAVAAFERTLVTPRSAYDRWAAGDKQALTPKQRRGLDTFDRLGCTGCHQPPRVFRAAQAQGAFRRLPVS
jgi:cytochrome c peroxidase